MKSADELRARLGGHMRESMGPHRQAAPPAAGAFHGETGPEKYRGAARIKDALAIEVERLAPDPGQPRKEFDADALADLAASLKARGQLQPIRVRWDDAVSRWIIVAGERRYRAAVMAGLPTLMCIEAKGEPSADEILEDQLVENCLRADLKPIEQAHAFRALIDRRGWSYRQLGESLHIAPASIARALALLELPAAVQQEVERGAMAPSVAYEVSRIADPEAQREVAARIVAEALTRDEVVEVVRKAAGRAGGAKGRGGKAKARRETERVIRTEAGPRITVEFRRGLDDALVRAALLDAVAQIDARADGESEAA